MKRNKNKKPKAKNFDFMKAIKKADRELELQSSPGFKSKTRVHKSKKAYDRKKIQKKFDNIEN